jgi:NTP pyrophosphatase (non-canonical NTP hydrolase)
LCRKSTGTAYATNGFVDTTDFVITKGKDNLSSFAFKPGRERHFCKSCGSPVYSSNADDPSRVRIRAGLIESDITERPVAHIFASSSANWDEISGSRPAYDEHEPGRHGEVVESQTPYVDSLSNCYTRANIHQSVNQVADICHGVATESGWWHDIESGEPIQRNKGELLCLIHSEISEAMEGVRKNLMDDKLPDRKMEEVELADAVIRILDYAGAHDLDIGGALAEKLAYNAQRADHKPQNRQKAGGKKF